MGTMGEYRVVNVESGDGELARNGDVCLGSWRAVAPIGVEEEAGVWRRK
jgi:hypothetical protein